MTPEDLMKKLAENPGAAVDLSPEEVDGLIDSLMEAGPSEGFLPRAETAEKACDVIASALYEQSSRELISALRQIGNVKCTLAQAMHLAQQGENEGLCDGIRLAMQTVSAVDAAATEAVTAATMEAAVGMLLGGLATKAQQATETDHAPVQENTDTETQEPVAQENCPDCRL